MHCLIAKLRNLFNGIKRILSDISHIGGNTQRKHSIFWSDHGHSSPWHFVILNILIKCVAFQVQRIFYRIKNELIVPSLQDLNEHTRTQCFIFFGLEIKLNF